LRLENLLLGDFTWIGGQFDNSSGAAAAHARWTDSRNVRATPLTPLGGTLPLRICITSGTIIRV
jgi:hypothetical protein